MGLVLPLFGFVSFLSCYLVLLSHVFALRRSWKAEERVELSSHLELKLYNLILKSDIDLEEKFKVI